MKGDRKVINNFVKTWIWLMDYYIGLYLDLDVRIMKNFLEKGIKTDKFDPEKFNEEIIEKVKKIMCQ